MANLEQTGPQKNLPPIFYLISKSLELTTRNKFELLNNILAWLLFVESFNDKIKSLGEEYTTTPIEEKLLNKLDIVLVDPPFKDFVLTVNFERYEIDQKYLEKMQNLPSILPGQYVCLLASVEFMPNNDLNIYQVQITMFNIECKNGEFTFDTLMDIAKYNFGILWRGLKFMGYNNAKIRAVGNKNKCVFYVTARAICLVKDSKINHLDLQPRNIQTKIGFKFLKKHIN